MHIYPTTHLLEWLTLKRLTTLSSDKNMEQVELLLEVLIGTL